MISQNASTITTDSSAWIMYLSSHGTLGKGGGKSKLLTPGASNVPESSGISRPTRGLPSIWSVGQ